MTRTSSPFSRAAVTGGLATCTVILGILGLHLDPVYDGNWTTYLFDAAALLVLSEPSPAPTHPFYVLARLTAVVFAGLAAVSVALRLSGTLRSRLRLWRLHQRSARSPSRAHAVVIGLGPLADPLITDLLAEGRGVIALGNPLTPQQQAEIEAAGAVAQSGDARTPQVRTRLGLDHASEVFLTAPSDATNLDIAGALRGACPERAAGTPLETYVHVGASAYAGLFRMHDLFSCNRDQIQFHLFSSHERAARDLLLDPDRGLATRYAPGPGDVPHYVILGFGAAGQAIALTAARLAHFRGHHRLRMTIVDDFYDAERRVTSAFEARREFLARIPSFCPALGSLDLAAHARSSDPNKDAWHDRTYHPACDPVCREDPGIEYVVNAEFIDCPPETPDLADLLIQRFTTEGDAPIAPAIIACFDDDGRSFRAAHRLRRLMRDLWPPPPERITSPTEATTMEDAPQNTESPRPVVPTYVYLPVEEGLAELSEDAASERFPLYPFGSHQVVARHASVARPKIGRLARQIHERYNATSDSPTPWTDLSLAFRLSNEDAAAHAAVKLQAMGYRWDAFDDDSTRSSSIMAASSPRKRIPAHEIGVERDLEDLAEMEHNRFVAERLLNGWGFETVPSGFAVESEDRKSEILAAMKARDRSPALIPYAKLSDPDQEKDRQQVRALPELLEEMGETVTVRESGHVNSATS